MSLWYLVVLGEHDPVPVQFLLEVEAPLSILHVSVAKDERDDANGDQRGSRVGNLLLRPEVHKSGQGDRQVHARNDEADLGQGDYPEQPVYKGERGHTRPDIVKGVGVGDVRSKRLGVCLVDA